MTKLTESQFKHYTFGIINTYGGDHLYIQLEEILKAIRECLVGEGGFKEGSFPLIWLSQNVLNNRYKNENERIQDEQLLFNELERIRDLSITNISGHNYLAAEFNSISAQIFYNHEKRKKKKASEGYIYDVKNLVFWTVKQSVHSILININQDNIDELIVKMKSVITFLDRVNSNTHSPKIAMYKSGTRNWFAESCNIIKEKIEYLFNKLHDIKKQKTLSRHLESLESDIYELINNSIYMLYALRMSQNLNNNPRIIELCDIVRIHGRDEKFLVDMSKCPVGNIVINIVQCKAMDHILQKPRQFIMNNPYNEMISVEALQMKLRPLFKKNERSMEYVFKGEKIEPNTIDSITRFGLYITYFAYIYHIFELYIDYIKTAGEVRGSIANQKVIEALHVILLKCTNAMQLDLHNIKGLLNDHYKSHATNVYRLIGTDNNAGSIMTTFEEIAKCTKNVSLTDIEQKEHEIINFLEEFIQKIQISQIQELVNSSNALAQAITFKKEEKRKILNQENPSNANSNNINMEQMLALVRQQVREEIQQDQALVRQQLQEEIRQQLQEEMLERMQQDQALVRQQLLATQLSTFEENLSLILHMAKHVQVNIEDYPTLKPKFALRIAKVINEVTTKQTAIKRIDTLDELKEVKSCIDSSQKMFNTISVKQERVGLVKKYYGIQILTELDNNILVSQNIGNVDLISAAKARSSTQNSHASKAAGTVVVVGGIIVIAVKSGIGIVTVGAAATGLIVKFLNYGVDSVVGENNRWVLSAKNALLMLEVPVNKVKHYVLLICRMLGNWVQLLGEIIRGQVVKSLDDNEVKRGYKYVIKTLGCGIEMLGSYIFRFSTYCDLVKEVYKKEFADNMKTFKNYFLQPCINMFKTVTTSRMLKNFKNLMKILTIHTKRVVYIMIDPRYGHIINSTIVSEKIDRLTNGLQEIDITAVNEDNTTTKLQRYKNAINDFFCKTIMFMHTYFRSDILGNTDIESTVYLNKPDVQIKQNNDHENCFRVFPIYSKSGDEAIKMNNMFRRVYGYCMGATISLINEYIKSHRKTIEAGKADDTQAQGRIASYAENVIVSKVEELSQGL